MRALTNTLMLSFSCAILIPNTLWSKDMGTTQGNSRPQSGWSSSLQGGAQSASSMDLDDGGSYSSNRYNIQASRNYLWNPRTSASLALSYRHTDYQFSGGDTGSLASLTPWDKVHSLSISTPLRTGINDRWSGFLVPFVSFTGESDAEFSEGITAGAFAGATYQFSKDLSIGPGLGVSSQLEDSTSVFPLVIIKWNINDQLRFDLGGSQGAAQGPGITLSYKANRQWQYSLGGYYDTQRFRLDDTGVAAKGIGEESAFPVIASASYNLNPVTKITLMAGVKLSGELTVEDSDGDQILEESSDTSVIGGINFSMRL